MGLFLHFGAGQNQLPEPWQNLNEAHDIRKPLRFGTGEASAILAEHVIEHVGFLHGVQFLTECRRLLEPGGKLRIAFPDVGRFVDDGGRGVFDLNARALHYVDELEHHPRVTIEPGPARDRARAALRQLLTGWQHMTAWTEASAAGVLVALGFFDVRRHAYGIGELGKFDGHHLEMGKAAELESSIFEATR